MPDLPTRLARKWCQSCVSEKLNQWPTGGHSHLAIAAAIREALKKVEQVVQKGCQRERYHGYDDICPICAIHIAALATLREP